MLYTLRFFSSKCSLFHNANLFSSCIIHILYTGYAKIEKNNSGAKGLKMEFLYEIGGCWSLNMPCSQLGTVFWRCLLLPASVWKSSPVLKMEAVCSSKILVHPYQTTWCHIPENHNLNCHISSLYIFCPFVSWSHFQEAIQ